MEPTEALALVAGKVDDELLLRNEYLAHYHFERNHQGVGNALLVQVPDENPSPLDDRPTSACEDVGGGDIVCCERLGGLLRFYYRKSA